MAASDGFYRDQKALNVVFAASCVVMLVSIVWMFAEDYNRPFKKDQRVFRDVEAEVNKRIVLDLAPDDAARAKILEAEQAFVTAKAVVDAAKAKAQLKAAGYAVDKIKLEVRSQNVKADYDSKVSLYNIEVDHHGADSKAAKDLLFEIDSLKIQMQELKPQLEKVIADINAIDNEEFEFSVGKGKYKLSVNQAIDQLTAAERTHKEKTADFDRFVKLTAQKEWKWSDTVRALPILDGFASPVKIQQTTLEELPIDYGGFKYVTRYDRCTTCHLGMEKAIYDKATLAKLTSDPNADADLQAKVKNARALLEERQKVNPDAKQDINLLKSRDLEPAAVNLSRAQVAMFSAHPRLDLFVGADSPHSMEKFGCTSCHSGQGSSTTFVEASHSPNDAPTHEQWVKEHNFHRIHFWDFPMNPARFVESGCLKCHHQVEGLIRDGSIDEAPKLTKGYNLVRELGCFGCHEIAGMKGGRWVGPDMRLEPETPPELLSPAERAKLYSDPTDPPGTFRKVGPSLQRIAEKTNETWSAKWLKAPREFRPDTKMPHFYLQANNVPDALKGTGQEKFPDAEVAAVTHYLFATSRQLLMSASLHANDAADVRKADEEKLQQLTNKLASSGLSDAEKRDVKAEVLAVKARINARKFVPPVGDTLQLPPLPADEKALELLKAKGRHLFALRGCMACHQHDGTAEAAIAPDDSPLPAMTGESNFGPDLSRLAAKIGPKVNDPQSGRAWLVQWLLNPMVHSPRTLMPVVHLTTDEADAISAWLLSQKADWTGVELETPTTQALKDLAKVYLEKALTKRELDEVLSKGFSSEDLKYRPADSDEQFLSAPLTDDKLKMYVGKKAIGNLGCYACHTISGFENAKPIGAALNDWGKKEVERIAFEDGHAYVHEHYHAAKLRNDPADPSKPAEGWKYHAADGKHGKLPLEQFAPYGTDKQPPYEEFFADMLDHHHLQREGFLHLKLMSPRAYDYNRLKAWDERTRMPQFKFNRTKKRPNESDEDFKIRSNKEEAEAREAVMTFILGLVAEPVPPKFVYNPAGDKSAMIQGRQVLEKYNCGGCHLVRPGVFEFKLTDDKLPDGRSCREASLASLSMTYTGNQSQEEADPKDRPFPDHNAWGAAPQVKADRVRVKGVKALSLDGDGNLSPVIRQTNAVRFKDAEGQDRTIPANTTFPLFAPPGAVRTLGDAFGGTFAGILKKYLSDFDPKTYGDPTDVNRLDDANGGGPEGYAAVPPPLLHQGERVQPGWLFRFLLNPHPLRPTRALRMPKFSMSDEEAMALVNYFTAVNKLTNPGVEVSYPYTQVPQRDEEYLRKKTRDYVRRLKEQGWYDSRITEMKPVWERVAKEQLAAAEERLASAKKANAADQVAALDKDVAALKVKVQAGQFDDQRQQWEEREAYVGDAWKLMTVGSQCQSCHHIGPVAPIAYRAPNLNEAWERLRPDWSEHWIAYPQRLTPYASLMQPLYAAGEAKKHSDAKLFAGTPADMIEASRDFLMLYPMVRDWPVINYRMPGPITPTATAAAGGQ